MNLITLTPDPPYYAVIFTSIMSISTIEYKMMAEKMENLAKLQPGYIGVESAKDNSSLGITVSYWKDETSIAKWKNNVDHELAQKLGKEKWYSGYTVRIAKVERAYDSDE